MIAGLILNSKLSLFSLIGCLWVFLFRVSEGFLILSKTGTWKKRGMKQNLVNKAKEHWPRPLKLSMPFKGLFYLLWEPTCLNRRWGWGRRMWDNTLGASNVAAAQPRAEKLARETPYGGLLEKSFCFLIWEAQICFSASLWHPRLSPSFPIPKVL